MSESERPAGSPEPPEGAASWPSADGAAAYDPTVASEVPPGYVVPTAYGPVGYGQPGYEPSGYPTPGYPPYDYVPAGPYGPSGYYPRPWSGLAIAGFVVSFFAWLGVLGLILSAIALRETGAGRKQGRGLAIAGVVIGSLWLLVLLAAIVAIVGSASRCAEGLASCS